MGMTGRAGDEFAGNRKGPTRPAVPRTGLRRNFPFCGQQENRLRRQVFASFSYCWRFCSSTGITSTNSTSRI